MKKNAYLHKIELFYTYLKMMFNEMKYQNLYIYLFIEDSKLLIK